MKKLLLIIVVLAIIVFAVNYYTNIFKGKKSVVVTQAYRYYGGGSSDEVVAVVENNGEAYVTISGYEVYSKPKNGMGRWNSASEAELSVRLEPGQSQNISLGTSSIPNTAGAFKIKLYVTGATGSTYKIYWEGEE